MNISIIGTGNFARIVGRSLQEKHNIIFGSRTPDLKKEWVSQIGSTASVRTQREAIQANEIILISLNWPGNVVIDFLNEYATDLAGKTIIDITNVIQADYSPLRFPDHNSGAEKIQSLIPTAKVIKHLILPQAIQ